MTSPRILAAKARMEAYQATKAKSSGRHSRNKKTPVAEPLPFTVTAEHVGSKRQKTSGGTFVLPNAEPRFNGPGSEGVPSSSNSTAISETPRREWTPQTSDFDTPHTDLEQDLNEVVPLHGFTSDKIKGRYRSASDGEEIVVDWQDLPLSIRSRAAEVLNVGKTRKHNWPTGLSATKQCIGSYNYGQQTKQSRNDTKHASCKTCTNVRKLCMWYDNGVAYVVPPSRALRQTTDDASMAFWEMGNIKAPKTEWMG